MAVSKKKVSRKKQGRKTAKKKTTARRKTSAKKRASKPAAKKRTAKKASTKRMSTKKKAVTKASTKKAAAKKKTAKKASTKRPSTKKKAVTKVSTKKAAAKKKTAKKVSAKKPAAKKKAVTKASAKKPAAKKSRPKKEQQGEIKITPTDVEQVTEDRMGTPLSEIERMVDLIRDRADQVREITNFDPLNPLTFNPMTWEIPSWKDIQHVFDLRVPTVDVIDREKDILVIAEVPGVEKDDIAVTATNRSVTIRGVRRGKSRSDDDEIHRHEIRKGSFSRTIPLPEEVDGPKAKAVYKAGVVEMRLPKRRVSKKHNIALD